MPTSQQAARFEPGFGQRALLTVDTEEEFDWDEDFSRDSYSLEHVKYLARFQEFCEGLAITPVYLVDWPIANYSYAIEILGDAVKRGKAEIGIQLHPWVNPPHEEVVSHFTSYAGNLPPALEREKFARLHEVIVKNFGTSPQIYRAGRYGLGPQTAQLLKDFAVPIDSSVRSGFDYRQGHGPNYSCHPITPYWVDEERHLMELPLTTVYWGMLRRQGSWLHPKMCKIPRLGGAMARLGLLEKISLTPEGVSVDEALRGIDMALDDQLDVLVLSFHSPSLMPGHTPYIRSESDLDDFYEWWRTIYAYLDQRGVKPVSVAELMQATVLD